MSDSSKDTTSSPSKVDVVVTDGFTGNVALKTMEGVARLIADALREEFTRNPLRKLGRARRASEPRRFAHPPRPETIQWRHHGRSGRHRDQEPRRRRPVRFSARHRGGGARGSQRRAGADRGTVGRPQRTLRRGSRMYSRIAGTGSLSAGKDSDQRGSRAAGRHQRRVDPHPHRHRAPPRRRPRTRPRPTSPSTPRGARWTPPRSAPRTSI